MENGRQEMENGRQESQETKTVFYTECRKAQIFYGGNFDGCQEFVPPPDEAPPCYDTYCAICGCHQSFHRKVQVVYMECNKLHRYEGHSSVDGCKEFRPKAGSPMECAVCGCDRGFHRKEV